MPESLAVALGGAIGSLLRWWVALLAQSASVAFPWGTLAINVSGSFLLGFLAPWLLANEASPALRLALTVGLCGGYTTFSTFSLETARLVEAGTWGRAALYAGSSVALSVLATFVGLATARAVK